MLINQLAKGMTGGAEDQEEEGSEEVGPSLSLAIQEVYNLTKINPLTISALLLV